MDGQALGRGQQLMVCSHDTAGKITGRVENARTAGAQQRVGHFAHDPIEPVRQQGELNAVQRVGLNRCCAGR